MKVDEIKEYFSCFTLPKGKWSNTYMVKDPKYVKCLLFKQTTNDGVIPVQGYEDQNLRELTSEANKTGFQTFETQGGVFLVKGNKKPIQCQVCGDEKSEPRCFY